MKQVRDIKELNSEVRTGISRLGISADLNYIDTSLITDMSFLFSYSKFNGDISKWDTSKVENMCGMFFRSKFNGDISKWDVGRVRNMSDMFYNSKFNGDISRWDVSRVTNTCGMFFDSNFRGYIGSWNISNIKNADGMFKMASSIKGIYLLNRDRPDLKLADQFNPEVLYRYLSRWIEYDKPKIKKKNKKD